MTWRNHKREFHKPIINKFPKSEFSLMSSMVKEGGCFAKIVFSIICLSFVLFIVSACAKTYLELYYYEVKFTKGDSYYVAPGKYEITDGKIEFRSLIFDRKVEGYDFRIIEPIFK